MAIMNDGSSTEACVEASVIQEIIPAQREETSAEAEIATYNTVARKLSLDPLGDEVEGLGNSDLKGFEDESNTGGNGTVTRTLVEKMSGEEENMTENEQEKKSNEPWVNMF